MALERTLVIIKPDGVANDWVNDIIERYMQAGLHLVRGRSHRFQRKQAEELYVEHVGKPYFTGLVLAMTSERSMALILEGEDAIEKVRALHGATDPAKAEPGTIRHDFRSAGGPFNTVHASDSPEAVIRETEIAFHGTD